MGVTQPPTPPGIAGIGTVVSAWNSPIRFPSGSRTRAFQPTVGIGIFSLSSVPPAAARNETQCRTGAVMSTGQVVLVQNGCRPRCARPPKGGLMEE